MEESYLPQYEDLTEIPQAEQMPGFTYKVDIDNKRISGFTDGIEALQQTILHILCVERYSRVIYSDNYGVELDDLIGQPPDLVMTEVKRRISDALLQDDRIDHIDGWAFERTGEKMTVTFTIYSAYGNLEETKELVL